MEICREITFSRCDEEKLPRTMTTVWLEAQAQEELWLFGRRGGTEEIIEEEAMKYV